jgi:hypothetical protein
MFFYHFQWLWGHGCSSDISQFYPILDAIALSDMAKSMELVYNDYLPGNSGGFHIRA